MRYNNQGIKYRSSKQQDGQFMKLMHGSWLIFHPKSKTEGSRHQQSCTQWFRDGSYSQRWVVQILWQAVTNFDSQQPKKRDESTRRHKPSTWQIAWRSRHELWVPRLLVQILHSHFFHPNRVEHETYYLHKTFIITVYITTTPTFLTTTLYMSIININQYIYIYIHIKMCVILMTHTLFQFFWESGRGFGRHSCF